MISVAENEIIKTQKKEREKIEISCIWCLCDDFSFLQQTFPLNVMFIFAITTAAVSFHWLLRQVIKTKNMAKTKNSNLNFNAFEKFAKEEEKKNQKTWRHVTVVRVCVVTNMWWHIELWCLER